MIRFTGLRLKNVTKWLILKVFEVVKDELDWLRNMAY